MGERTHDGVEGRMGFGLDRMGTTVLETGGDLLTDDRQMIGDLDTLLGALSGIAVLSSSLMKPARGLRHAIFSYHLTTGLELTSCLEERISHPACRPFSLARQSALVPWMGRSAKGHTAPEY